MSIWTSMTRTTLTVIVAGALIAAAGCNKATDKANADVGGATPALSAKAAAVAPVAPLSVRTPAEPQRDPATVLVSVGESKLTLGEVEKQLAPMMAQMGDDPRAAAMKGRFYQQAAERFVMRTLLSQEADRRKIKVADAEVNEAVGTITNRLPAGMTLEAALEREGKTVADFRKDLATELRIKSLVESEVPTNSAVSDADVTALFEKEKEHLATPETVTARHILIKAEKTDAESVRAEKKAKAEALRKQLIDGADFAKLAKENSEDPGSKDSGGSYTFPRGKMVPEFEKAAFDRPVNEIGPLVETDYGYHIIQTTEHKKGGSTSLEDVKPRLVEYLKQKKQMELFEKFIAGLKSKVTITYDDSVKPQPRAAGMPGPMGE